MDFIDDLNLQEHPRYILLILRNTLESTIVFKALNKKHSTVPEIYADYLGKYVDLGCYESINTTDDNPQQVLKNLGGNRMTLYRNNFRELSQILKFLKMRPLYIIYIKFYLIIVITVILKILWNLLQLLNRIMTSPKVRTNVKK